MLKLIDLKPRHMGNPRLGQSPWTDDPQRTWHEIAFLCPKCRKHEISVAFWSGPARNRVQIGEHPHGTPVVRRLWHREGTQGFLDLTLTPSINREDRMDRCGGWHGHITNGEITP
jgi:hypothetical protein